MLLRLSNQAHLLTKQAGLLGIGGRMLLGGPKRRAAALTGLAVAGLGAHGFARGMRAQHYDPEGVIPNPVHEAGPIRRAAGSVATRGFSGSVQQLPGALGREFTQTVQGAGEWE